MKYFFLTIYVIITLSSNVFAKNICDSDPIKVAVIDTGFGYEGLGKGAKLCKFGHKNFTDNNEYFYTGFSTIDPIPVDHHGHGTHIAGIIDNHAGNSNYCIIILKYYDPIARYHHNIRDEIDAIKYATNIGVDIINLSSGGDEPVDVETRAIENFINKGGIFITSAGNYGKDLAKEPFYPACSVPKALVVGSISNNGRVSDFSGRGSRINLWEKGEDVTAYGITSSGTSQATATATGKLLAFIKKKCYKHKGSIVTKENK